MSGAAQRETSMFDGTLVLLPPGTRIGADVGGNWVLLAADGVPASFGMPPDNIIAMLETAYEVGGPAA